MGGHSIFVIMFGALRFIIVSKVLMEISVVVTLTYNFLYYSEGPNNFASDSSKEPSYYNICDRVLLEILLI